MGQSDLMIFFMIHGKSDSTSVLIPPCYSCYIFCENLFVCNLLDYLYCPLRLLLPTTWNLVVLHVFKNAIGIHFIHICFRIECRFRC